MNYNWYKAEIEGREGKLCRHRKTSFTVKSKYLHTGLIPSNYIEMQPHSWYYGRITSANSEKLLGDKHVGAFLVRANTETSLGNFHLSVKSRDGVQHFEVLRDAAKSN